MGILINATERVQFQDVASLSFNGTDEYATVDDAADDVDARYGTLSAWVKMDATSNNGAVVKISADSTNLIQMLFVNSDTTMRFYYTGDGNHSVISADFNHEGDDTWYHICLTYDTTVGEGEEAGELKAYINTTLKDTNVGLTNIQGTINQFYLGRNTTTSNSFHVGHIAHVSYFNTVVSPTILYNGGKPGNLNGMDNLVLWLPMREGSGTTLKDHSPQLSDATLVNTPTWTVDTATAV